MTRRTGSRRARGLASAALAVALLLCAPGCKPTDFFTEVIIRDYAQEVDVDNEEKVTVNSPDAEAESDDLSALDWSDDAARSVAVQKLVVYSKQPNTELSTHHSVFDLKPRFAGIEASDGVRLTYDSGADLDAPAQAAEADSQPDEAESTGAGGQQAAEEPGRADSGMAADAPETQEGRDASQPASSEGRATDAPSGGGTADGAQPSAGGSPDGQEPGPSGSLDYDLPGSSGGSGEGDGSGTAPGGSDADPGNTGSGSTDDPEGTGGGQSPDPYGGYAGTVPWYGQDGVYSVPPSADRVAVLGADALVLARAIGGPGAVCATSRDAWLGLDFDGDRRAYSYYGQVYAAEESSTPICWDGAGSSPQDCNIEALVAACGEGGVIVYDQRLGNQQTFFSDEQRRELYAAGITLVPVELSSVQGLIDAANLLGTVLEGSATCAASGHDARQYADDYMAFVDDVVRACAATRVEGGSWLATDAYWGSLGSSVYWGCPVTQLRRAGAYALISDDSEFGMAYHGDVDVSDVVLFRTGGKDAPLTFWQQVAGVWDGAYVTSGNYGSSVIYTPLLRWQSDPLSINDFSGSPGGAYSRFSGSQYGRAFSFMDYIQQGAIDGAWGPGLGTANVPYLIVSAPKDRGEGTSADVKRAVLASMTSADAGGNLTLYSALSYGEQPSGGPHYGDSGFFSTIGFVAVSGVQESPFYQSSLALADVVRENPTGLLGDWTGGSMESVLEAVWLTELYSRSPAGCAYAPVNDMSSFSVNVGGVTCTSTREVVLAFYDHFYDVDASGFYGQVVADGGL